jgi:hypothetical protein
MIAEQLLGPNLFHHYRTVSMARLDAALLEQILDIAQRQRKADVKHYRQADNLRAGLEVAESGAFCHMARQVGRPALHNRSSSDNTLYIMQSERAQYEEYHAQAHVLEGRRGLAD